MEQTFREAQRNFKSAVSSLKDKIDDTQRKINQVNDEKDKAIKRLEDQKVNLQKRMGELAEKKKAKISELEGAMQEHEARVFLIVSIFLVSYANRS